MHLVFSCIPVTVALISHQFYLHDVEAADPEPCEEDPSLDGRPRDQQVGVAREGGRGHSARSGCTSHCVSMLLWLRAKQGWPTFYWEWEQRQLKLTPFEISTAQWT